MPATPRVRVAPGLYRDGSGLSAIAQAGGRRRERRFPLDTARAVIRQWQDETRRALRDARTQRTAALPAGSLADDIARYLALLPTVRRKEDAYLLAHWSEALGPRRRVDLTAADLRAVESGWDVAASTVKHRRHALQRLYTTLDGPEAVCPTRGLPRLATPLPPVRAVPFALAVRVLTYLPARGRPVAGERRSTVNRSAIRLRLLLYTGLPPSTLKRLTPDDVDLEAGTVRIPPRRKGRGAPPATLPLLPEARTAFRDWIVAAAWGPFSTQALGHSLKRAVRAAQDAGEPVPDWVSPYSLRHTFLAHVLAHSGDLAAVAELAQHSTLAMTRRYTQLAASVRAKTALESVVNAGGKPATNGGKS